MENILLSHGSGGRKMHELIDKLFIAKLGGPALKEKGDSAVIDMGAKKYAFTTDSYVVSPIFFPGGDIGRLAVCGTVNDLAVCGAKPLYMSLGMVMEEGFDRKALERIVVSIRAASKEAGVEIATGDTKVVEKGSCDGIFINTSGIGEVFYGGLGRRGIRFGDAVIVSGPVGDHAISVLSRREGMNFDVRVKSDAAPINRLIRRALDASDGIRFMRDPTRGGLATTLNEIAAGGRFGIEIDESAVPVRGPVKGACELLGYDPLYLACEGRVIIIAEREDAVKIVRSIKKDRYGKGAAVIGRVTSGPKGRACLNTRSGGRRILDMLAGEQLPRIC